MAPISILFGMLLTLLGVGGYLYTDRVSLTALIPAAVGGPLLLLGVLALRESIRKHAMHAAVVIGLLGFLGATGDALRRYFTGKLEMGPGAISLVLMAALCLLFVALCVKSFINARRARSG